MTNGPAQGKLDKGSENQCHDYFDRLKDEVLSSQQVITESLISFLLIMCMSLRNHQLLTADTSHVCNLDTLDDSVNRFSRETPEFMNS